MTAYDDARTALDTLLSSTARGTITAQLLKDRLLAIFDAYEEEQVTATEGPQGEPGISAGYSYRWKTSVSDSDPLDGYVKSNHLTYGSITYLYISKTSAEEEDLATRLATWDDSTNVGHKGTLLLRATDGSGYLDCDITGAVTVETEYVKVPVDVKATGGTFSDETDLRVFWQRSGNSGDLTAAASFATDNMLLRSDGTGKGVQVSAIPVDDNGGMALPATLALTGVITPSQITATQNDYAPTGHATAAVFRLDGDADGRLITGLAGGTNGRVVLFRNVGTKILVLSSEHTGSTAANRFATTGSTTLLPGASAVFIYDGTLLRWKKASESLAGWRRTALANNVENADAIANTLADVTGLAFPVEASKKYAFRAVIGYTAAATTTGSRWTLSGPSGATPYFKVTATLTATTDSTAYAAAFGDPSSAGATSLTAGNIAIIEGTVSVAGTAGSVQVRFASEVAGSAITALAAHTYIEWVELN